MKRKTEHFTYELIRAKRRSMSLKVDLDGTITVRAPYRTPVQTAEGNTEICTVPLQNINGDK